MNSAVLLPGATGPNGQMMTLGVMGGGQLGRMFIEAAHRMGYLSAVLDPDPSSPAGLISHYHVATDYLDQMGLAQMLQRCAAITTEFENVPAPALRTLGATRQTAPPADAVAIAQDRILEKSHLAGCGVPVAPYAVIATESDIAQVPPHLLPGILKTARLGYDGKGQVHIQSLDELAAAWQSLQQVPCVLEQRLPLATECSVIVARGADGQCVHFAPQRNLHRNGILAVTQAFDGVLPSTVTQPAIQAAMAIAHHLNYVGVLCVEFFVLQNDTPAQRTLGPLVVNEIAPRPHNSGHHTIDAYDVSQFDLQVRTMAGLPLPTPRQHSAAVMLNLLGDLWPCNRAPSVSVETPPWADILALPGVHLHLYGKVQAKPGRKMGHVTITAHQPAQALALAQQVAQILGIDPF